MQSENGFLPGDPAYYPNYDACRKSLSVGIPKFENVKDRLEIREIKHF